MNSAAIAGLLLVASVLTPSAFLIYDNAVQTQVDDLNAQFNNIMNKTDTIMNQTNSFLDHAWDIAQNFKNPNYDYDPSQLGNYTAPSTTPNTTTEIQLATK